MPHIRVTFSPDDTPKQVAEKLNRQRTDIERTLARLAVSPSGVVIGSSSSSGGTGATGATGGPGPNATVYKGVEANAMAAGTVITFPNPFAALGYVVSVRGYLHSNTLSVVNVGVVKSLASMIVKPDFDNTDVDWTARLATPMGIEVSVGKALGVTITFATAYASVNDYVVHVRGYLHANELSNVNVGVAKDLASMRLVPDFDGTDIEWSIDQ